MRTGPTLESLAPFFPEYHLSDLDLEMTSATIIERTLLHNNRAEIHWLFELYSSPQILA
jgi:hypothetical protein